MFARLWARHVCRRFAKRKRPLPSREDHMYLLIPNINELVVKRFVSTIGPMFDTVNPSIPHCSTFLFSWCVLYIVLSIGLSFFFSNGRKTFTNLVVIVIQDDAKVTCNASRCSQLDSNVFWRCVFHTNHCSLAFELWHKLNFRLVSSFWTYSIQSHHICLCFIDFFSDRNSHGVFLLHLLVCPFFLWSCYHLHIDGYIHFSTYDTPTYLKHLFLPGAWFWFRPCWKALVTPFS